MSDAAVETADLLVVGAGAAGLATAIFAARAAPGAGIVCVDGARRIGAKILVSGGSRCNVTNRVVTERDFWGGSARVVRHVLRAFPTERATQFFGDLGVTLHEEEDGKLFPDSNRARDVLEALVREAEALKVSIDTGQRVRAVDRNADGFVVHLAGAPPRRARLLALATGGRSLPKTGSDGGGYSLAASLGHGHVETTPALVPLILADDWHAELSGVSLPAEISVRVNGRIATRLSGSLLWTHFGASGPVVLDSSRHWHRARLEGATVDLLLNSCPGMSFELMDRWLVEQQRDRPKASIVGVVATRLPAALATCYVKAAGAEASFTMAHLERDVRRALVRLVTELPLAVTDSRGYNYAEVTAGGVPLDEIDSGTMQSRRCEGLYLAGEILDVDGRLGGFNFQWAWSSGFVAGTAAGQALGQVRADRLIDGL